MRTHSTVKSGNNALGTASASDQRKGKPLSAHVDRVNVDGRDSDVKFLRKLSFSSRMRCVVCAADRDVRHQLVMSLGT